MNAPRLFSLAFALALLAGCGNKGPLVLPTQPAPIDPATMPDAPEDDEGDATPDDTGEPVEEGATPPDEVPADTPATGDGDGNG